MDNDEIYAVAEEGAEAAPNEAEQSGVEQPGTGQPGPEQFPSGDGENRKPAAEAEAPEEAPEEAGPREGAPVDNAPLGSMPAAEGADVRQWQINRGTGRSFQEQLMLDLEEVSDIDPEIRGLRDLRRKPEYPKICKLLENGINLPAAYKLVCFDELLDRGKRASRQAAINSVSGKEHMRQSAVRGEGAASVPPEVAEEYRLFLPDISYAEMQEHYNKCSRESR